jgi:NAD+ kinase
MTRVGVLVHPVRPVGDALEVLRDWAQEHGLNVVQIQVGDQPEVAPPGQPMDCDVIVALGGDGTVLKALHAAAKSSAPVLGVAYGSLGALTTVAAEDLRSGLEQFAAGAFVREHLPGLALASDHGEHATAINDVALVRSGGTQLVVELRVEGELYVRLAGDGIAIATPLGSSAYSMAAGGSLLAGGIDGFICTPLAMHGGCAPPVVVPQQLGISLEVQPGHDGFGVQVDGFRLETQAEHFTLSCQAGYATLARLDGASSDLTRLRQRGLIADSPRVLAQRHRAAASGRLE